MSDWRVLHKEVIVDFLTFINKVDNRFVLKGGTALMLCYGLSRFSEDIDLDGFDRGSFFKDVDSFVKMFSQKYPGIYARRAKDTDTVKRVFIHYGGMKPLKIEVSYRKKSISSSEYCVIGGILVYTISGILVMKLNAFSSRDKIRDLYDITFLYSNYYGYFSERDLASLRDILSYKGFEYFDYIVRTQQDDLIDNNQLADAFISMYYSLGLI